jgi:hypothetical protein
MKQASSLLHDDAHGPFVSRREADMHVQINTQEKRSHSAEGQTRRRRWGRYVKIKANDPSGRVAGRGGLL